MVTTANREIQTQTTEKEGNGLLDEVLAQGVNRETLLQMKMEHESIMTECRVRHRDLTAILKELEERMNACPELAREAIYTKPIGTVFEVTCECGTKYEVGVNRQGYNSSPRQEECDRCGKWAPKSSREVKKKARNLSIRMAEELAEMYGFNRVHAAVTIVDANHAKVTASFFDYQRLRSWISEAIVSRLAKGKGGSTYAIAEDRFYDTIVKAAQSKIIREAILRSISQTLKLRAFALAERITAKTLSDDEVGKAVAAFSQRGVTLEQLEGYVGKTRREGWTNADRMELMEAWNALKDNEATVAELFGDAETPARSNDPSRIVGGASVDDLLKNPNHTETTNDNGHSTSEPDKLAQDMLRFKEVCSGAKTIGEVNAAENVLRGEKGRELSEPEAILAEQWKADSLERIRAGRGDRTNQKTLTE